MKHQILNVRKSFRFKRFARKAYSAFNSMHKSVTIGVLTGCTLLSACVMKTSAETPGHNRQTVMEGKELEEITVTASGVEVALEEAPRIITVIKRAEIEQAPVQSVQDLLKYVSGTDVRQRGANGVQADVSLRGGTSDQIAILLNGANLTNPQTGHYSFDIPVNLSDIERIEIIRGPAALIYGAGAFAGGINIITRKTPENKATFNIEGGMYGLWGATASGAFQSGDFNHRLSTGYSSSDGYTDNSEYKIFNTLWQSRLLHKNTTIDLQLGFNDKKYGANTFYSAAYPNQHDDTQSVFGSLKGKTGGTLKLIPQLYWSRHYDRFELVKGENPNYHRSDIYGFNLNLEYTSIIGTTIFGGELRNEGILSNVLGIPLEQANGKYTKSDNRSNISYFTEQNFMYKGLTISAGVLADHNTSLQEDFRFYPSGCIAYKISTPIRIYASWSKATRMPTFTDLYYKTKTHQGNSDLLPEESESYEMGVKFRNRLLSAYINTFYMKGKNVIDWVQKDTLQIWESMNFAELDKTGIETAVSLSLKEVFPSLKSEDNFTISYTFLQQTKNAEDSLYTINSNYALDYLKHKVTASLSHSIRKNLSAQWEFRWQDRQGIYDRYVDLKPAGKTTYQPYSILDLKLSWKQEKTEIYTTLNNIFNVTYNDLGNIPQPGFWLAAGICYRL